MKRLHHVDNLIFKGAQTSTAFINMIYGEVRNRHLIMILCCDYEIQSTVEYLDCNNRLC